MTMGDRSAEVDRNTGIISTGDHAHSEQHEHIHLPPVITPMDQVAAPSGLLNLPQRSEVFVGRADALTHIQHALTGPKPVVVAALHGLGGIGKSTLAAHYASIHQAEYTVVWWITADSPTAIDAGLADLARAIQPAVAGLPLEQQTAHGIAWLTAHEGWLLILDNINTPDDAQGLLARLSTGHILITSRLAHGWPKALSLDVLTSDEAVDMLTQIIRTTDRARELCAELGELPLAIDQAAAYIAQTGITPTEYLDLLAQYPEVMFTETGEGGDAQRTIARTWHVTLNHLSDTPETSHILRVLAWYAPDEIPRTLLDGIADKPTLLRALRRLSAYSMITLHPDHIDVHRLVQANNRASEHAAAARDFATKSLADALGGQSPIAPQTWPLYRALLPHVQALTDHSSAENDSRDTGFVLNACGQFLREHGNTQLALVYLQRSAIAAERALGADHPNTLISRSNLAYTYCAAGDLQRAIPMLETSLADRKRVLSPNHPDILISRTHLANAYYAAGHLQRAIPMLETILADYAQILGLDHRNTLGSRNNLANAYRAIGDLQRAIPMYETTLADRKRVQGPDHPDTLASRNNLGNAYCAAGDRQQVIPMLETTLADCERVLGVNHPTTSAVRENLEIARKYRDQEPGQT
jgi:tetratricopeptide (TPR) repeat protein